MPIASERPSGLVHLPMGLMWSMPVPVACSLAVAVAQDGDGFAASCGQCPLDDAGRVLDAGDSVAQARRVAASCTAVLAHLGQGFDAALLVVYHTAEPGAEEAALLATLGVEFPHAAIAPIRLPHFYYPGMRIEVDLYAVTGPIRLVRHEASGAALTVVSGGPLRLAHLAAPDAAGAARVLAASGLASDHLLSAQWFGTVQPPAAWVLDPAARVTPPPGDTGLCAVMTMASVPVITSQTPGGAILRQGGRFAWVSARSANPDLAMAAHEAMDALALGSLSGLTMLKATTHYAGGPGPEDLHGNLSVRHARFPRPGPASTGVPVAGLAGATLAIDMLACAIPANPS